jgi:pimeloyl-ACP methyl ester carboxylesterase
MEFEREMYVRSGIGTRLWTGSAGRGPAVMLCDGLGCDGYVWKHMLGDLARDHRVIRWHYRGHGNSDVPSDLQAMSVEGLAEDLFRVLDAWGEQEVILVGHSMGVQVVLEAALSVAPGRVRGVVALCGAPGRPLDTFKNTRLGLRVLPQVQRLARRWPLVFNELWGQVLPSRLARVFVQFFEINRTLIRVEELRPYLENLASMQPQVFLAMLDNASRHSTVDRLGEVGCPVLVVAAQRDSFTPLARSVEMHERIAGSELFILPEATHTGPLEWPEMLQLRLRKWMAQHDLTPAAVAPG